MSQVTYQVPGLPTVILVTVLVVAVPNAFGNAFARSNAFGNAFPRLAFHK